MKNNINKKVGATLLAAAIMAGTAVIPMSNAAVEAAATKAAKATNKPSIEYRTQVQDHAWMPWVSEGEISGTVGESRRMETLQVRMINCEGVSLKFYAHVQDIGDMWFTDKDEYVGTVAQSKRVEAIAITSEGLKEKGYKLQYRVQVQDYGWMPWVDDGEMAGTRYESKRLETIQIVVVPVENDDLAVEKAVAIDTLENYKAALSTLTDATLPEVDRNAIIAKIETAIEDIEKAETKADIDEKYDSIVNDIVKTYPEIEKLAEQNNKETAEEREKAMKEVEGYKNAVAQANLLDSERNSANIIIENATNAITNARTKKEVTTALGNLNSLMGQYTGVSQLKAQNIAIKELESYIGKVRPATKVTINNAIEEIKKAKDTTTIESKVNEIKELIEAQEKNYADLQAYKNTLPTISNSVIDSTDKALILLEISKTEEKIEKAENDTEVDEAMDTFNTYVEDYSALKTATADALLKNAINSAIAKLEVYLTGYEQYDGDANYDVQKLAKDAIAELKTGKNSEGTAVDISTPEAVNKLLGSFAKEDGTAGTGYLGNIETTINAIKEHEEDIKADYIIAYNNAMKELDGYYQNVSNTTLTNAQKNEVYAMINNTRATIAGVSTESAVEKAMDAFTGYIANYYEKAMIDQVKENAINELKAYKDSTIEGVKEKAEEGISAIEDLTGSNYTIANIDIELNDAKVEIQKIIDEKSIENAQADAISNIMTYQEEAKRVGASLKTATTEEINKAFKEDTGILVISKIPEGKTVSDVLNEINKTTQKIIELIKKDMNTTDDIVVKAQNDAKKELDEYAKIATTAGYTTLPSELEIYKAKISNAKTTAAVATAKADAKAYIERNYSLFNAQLVAINDLKEQKDNLTPNVDNDKIIAIIDKAIADLTKLTDKNDDKVVNASDITVITNKVTEDKTAVETQMTKLNNYKDTLKAKIADMESVSEETQANNYKDYYEKEVAKLRIDSVKWTEEGNIETDIKKQTTTVRNLIENAENMFNVTAKDDGSYEAK